MKAIEIVHDEHLSMAAMYDALSRLLDGVANKSFAMDVGLLANILDYMIREPEQLHHPKEDLYLFPALVKRDPATLKLVAKLEVEHLQGKNQVKELAISFVRLVSEGESAFQSFHEAVNSYTIHAVKHIALEEKELMPALRESLFPEDWDAINSEFQKNMTGISGPFKALFTKVVTKLPSPIGVG